MPGPISKRADRLVQRLFGKDDRSLRSEQEEKSEPAIPGIRKKFEALRKRKAPNVS